jgi:hypothetical protein
MLPTECGRDNLQSGGNFVQSATNGRDADPVHQVDPPLAECELEDVDAERPSSGSIFTLRFAGSGPFAPPSSGGLIWTWERARREGGMATDIEKLIQELHSLGADELRQLRRAVDERLSNPSESTGSERQEDEFKRRLVAAGLLNEVRPPVPDPESYRGRTPVPVTGKPLSETIVEERR